MASGILVHVRGQATVAVRGVMVADHEARGDHHVGGHDVVGVHVHRVVVQVV